MADAARAKSFELANRSPPVNAIRPTPPVPDRWLSPVASIEYTLTFARAAAVSAATHDGHSTLCAPSGGSSTSQTTVSPRQMIVLRRGGALVGVGRNPA